MARGVREGRKERVVVYLTEAEADAVFVVFGGDGRTISDAVRRAIRLALVAVAGQVEARKYP